MLHILQPGGRPAPRKPSDARRRAAFGPKLAAVLSVALGAVAAAGLLLTPWRGVPATPSVERGQTTRDFGGEGGAFAGTSEAKHSADEDARRRVGDAYARLPMSFEANEGQKDPRFKFISRGDGYGLFLAQHEAVLLLRGGGKEGLGSRRVAAGAETVAVTMRLEGSNPGARVTGERELPGRINYLVGREEGNWRRSVPAFAAVRYEGVYAGVDLVYYGNQRQLEYDFVVRPGADPASIRIRFGGGERLEVDAAGELVLHTAAGEVRQRKPFVYQESGGARREVAGAYALDGDGRVGFRVGDYDPTLPLVIDPVLVYATHLGGSNVESLSGLAVDSAGNAYVAGVTYSDDFPATAGAFKTRLPFQDAFVTKFNVVGNGVVYSTFIGGESANDFGMAVAVDGEGHAYIAGMTHSSSDFPVTPGAAQTTWGGGTDRSLTDAFVAKLNPAGSALVYSTYVGGGGVDDASDLAIDSAGSAYLAGTTISDNFPVTPGAYRPGRHGTSRFSYVTKLNAAGSTFAYSTYVGTGQQGGQFGFSTGPFVAVDSSGVAHLAGMTYNDDYPVTPGAFQMTKGLIEEDCYYSKLSADGTALLYSTFLGGRREERAAGVALDPAGNAYVAGTTDSDDFPTTAGAFDSTFNGSFSMNSAGFVTKFNPSGQVAYSTYFGAPTLPREGITSVAVNAAGEVWLAGNTNSAAFPVTADALRSAANGPDDNFIARLSADGASLLYSTRFGGTGNDYIHRIVLAASGDLYLAGASTSTDLPATPGSFQTGPSANGGLFVARLGAAAPSGHSIGGRVTDGTNPIAGAMVRLNGSLEGAQFTNADGRYSFGSLPAGGNYTVTPSSRLYDFGAQSRTFDNLSGNETADFTATMRRFRITGQVRDTGGNVLSGVTVNLSVGGVTRATTATDTDGRYAFADIPAVGTYDVRPFKANYDFTPSSLRFSNLTADVAAADFTGRLFYTVFGRITDTSGAPIPQVRVDLERIVDGRTFVVSGQTTSLGEYGFINLSPGQTYTVRPNSPAHSFEPASRTFANIGANHTADFIGTLTIATVSGRVVDDAGQPLRGVTIRVNGAPWHTTDFNGQYSFSLRKGQTYTAAPALVGYAFTPASRVIELSGNAVADFTARLLTPQPFTPGNILVSSDHVLSEYTPAGAQVQAVLIPQPSPTPVGNSHRTGDLAVDAGGEAWVLNSRPLALANFSRSRQSWQNVTLAITPFADGVGGLAVAGGYAFAPFSDEGPQGTTRGFVRQNLSDNTVARFERQSFGDYDVAAGPGNVLYALGLGANSNSARLSAYDQQTLQLLSERVVSIHTLAIAANAAGDLFLGTRQGQVSRLRANGDFVKQVSLGSEPLTDIDVSPDGRVAVSGGGRVTVLDEEFNVLGSFVPQTGEAWHVAFAKPASVARVEFAADGFTADEGAGRATVEVLRSGDITGPASVEYSTDDDQAAVRCDAANGAAYARCDYATTADTLHFAPGESRKTFTVPLVDDGHAEGAETVRLGLRRPSGALLGAVDSAGLTITDNDAAGAANPISGSRFFVRQHYLDFLNREPEPGEPWTGVLARCPDVNSDPACDRILVSSAFFQSPEFQLKGLYSYLFYRVAFGRLPAYTEIIRDMRGVTGATPEEVYQKRALLAASFAVRPEFTQLYGGMTNQQYVDALLGRYGLTQITTEDPADFEGTSQVRLTSPQLVQYLNNNWYNRAQVLRAVVQSNEADAAEYHGAFVAMQYYGYLRRTPEQSGYDAWLRVIRQDPQNIRQMVNGFLNSVEYRLRFGQP